MFSASLNPNLQGRYFQASLTGQEPGANGGPVSCSASSRGGGKAKIPTGASSTSVPPRKKRNRQTLPPVCPALGYVCVPKARGLSQTGPTRMTLPTLPPPGPWDRQPFRSSPEVCALGLGQGRTAPPPQVSYLPQVSTEERTEAVGTKFKGEPIRPMQGPTSACQPSWCLPPEHWPWETVFPCLGLMFLPQFVEYYFLATSGPTPTTGSLGQTTVGSCQLLEEKSSPNWSRGPHLGLTGATRHHPAPITCEVIACHFLAPATQPRWPLSLLASGLCTVSSLWPPWDSSMPTIPPPTGLVGTFLSLLNFVLL